MRQTSESVPRCGRITPSFRRREDTGCSCFPLAVICKLLPDSIIEISAALFGANTLFYLAIADGTQTRFARLNLLEAFGAVDLPRLDYFDEVRTNHLTPLPFAKATICGAPSRSVYASLLRTWGAESSFR